MGADVSERCLGTGVAGFVASHLAERLLQEDYGVVGVDCSPHTLRAKSREGPCRTNKGNRVSTLVQMQRYLDGVRQAQALQGLARVEHCWWLSSEREPDDQAILERTMERRTVFDCTAQTIQEQRTVANNYSSCA